MYMNEVTETQQFYENIIPDEYHVSSIDEAEQLRVIAQQMRIDATTQDEIKIADTLGRYASYMISNLEPDQYFQNIPAWMRSNLSRTNIPESVRVQLQQQGVPLSLLIAAGGLIIGIMILRKK